MHKRKETVPLSHYINNSSSTMFIKKNKIEIHQMQLKHKYRRTRQFTQVDFRKLLETQKTKSLQRKAVSTIGVDEGLITLPTIQPVKNWKKLTQEEIEVRNNIRLNKELMATLSNDAMTDFYNDNEETENEKYKQAKTEENEIKKLNNWDVQHDFNKKNFNRKSSADIAHLTQGIDSSSIKWMLEIKNNKRDLEVLSKNKYLQDFFNIIEEEQKAIFNQNMNINKKQVSFDAFEVSNQKTQKRSNFSNVDYYREIMKQKVKVEDYLKTELSSIAEKVFEKKQEKKKLMEQITQLLFDINNIKQETKKVIDTNTFEVKKLKDDISLGTLKSNDLFARSIKKKEKHAKNAEVKFHLQQQTAEKSDKRITN